MRDLRIAEARRGGERWASIAAREGVSEKTAIRSARRAEEAIAKRGVSLPEVLPDPSEIVAEIVASELVALRESVRMLGAADNDSARVGAARTVVSVGNGLHMALIRAGLVRSPDMEWFGAELRVAVQAIYKLADRFEIPADVVFETMNEIPRRGLPRAVVMPDG